MFCLCVNVCIIIVGGDHGDQRRESDPLKLESQEGERCHVEAGN